MEIQKPQMVITFLAGSKCLLISWLQSPSAVILGSISGSQLRATFALWGLLAASGDVFGCHSWEVATGI